MDYQKTVSHVDIDKFMGRWYVIAGRTTFLESGAHNSIEEYAWNEEEKRIDIDFKFNKGSFDGKVKNIPQTAWIENHQTNARWKVSPFWPLKFDYLVIDLADDYSWTAIGVPSGSYLWIMAREWDFSKEKLQKVINRLEKKGYPTEDIKEVPQKWPTKDS